MVLIYYQPGKTGKTPDELWKGYAPNIAYLKVWGRAPLNLWEEAILSACHIQNRISYKKFLGRLSRYTQSPNQVHWTIVHLFLKYLRGTINYGLCFSGFPSVLEGFSDANWISDSDEVKSTSGYVFIFGRSVVSLKSAKRICITRSTMEVEFIALENASSEVE
ncbi:Retrovirus-related Pol polyprotein from transposon TNT 1-94 [Vitis vinifera]|uniref:Retrovirus-related Pol polyprotein from transposon TNT 1-94 n=1 Tax=Vitis vinifera TaxID=29760 RepID=A0A438CTC3_VITVI|nr:Retrovirus-related Pol polyprotein from transposon TNT 1-94 [Vitis vinifera]